MIASSAFMIAAAYKALNDVFSPEFRSILFKAIGLTLLLFAAIIAGTIILLEMLKLVPWGWAETIIQVVAGLGLLVLSFFLMAPVTALFAGLYLDRIADIVEARHYPRDAPGRALSAGQALLTGLRFGLLVLLVNIAILPAVFFAIGAVVLVIANAYLLSREYFEMAAYRHMPVDEARQLRRENSPQVLAAGFIPALLALIPFVNLIVPLFSTSYFIHIFKQVAASSA
jgi:CysZ protein